jgi:hypothetical protein
MKEDSGTQSSSNMLYDFTKFIQENTLTRNELDNLGIHQMSDLKRDRKNERWEKDQRIL